MSLIAPGRLMGGISGGSYIPVAPPAGATISSVALIPASGRVDTAGAITVRVTWSEAVSIAVAAPRIGLTLDSGTVFAQAVAASGQVAHDFVYTVQAGDLDADGIAVAGLIDLNGQEITTESNGVPAVTNYAGQTPDGSGITVNTSAASLAEHAGRTPDGSASTASIGVASAVGVAPTVASTEFSPSTGNRLAGQLLSLPIGFSREVVLDGTMQVALAIGGQTRQATLTGSGTTATTLTPTYTIQAGDTDADGITSASAIVLAGGTLVAADDGTPVNLDFTGLEPDGGAITVNRAPATRRSRFTFGVTRGAPIEDQDARTIGNPIPGTWDSAEVYVDGARTIMPDGCYTEVRVEAVLAGTRHPVIGLMANGAALIANRPGNDANSAGAMLGVNLGGRMRYEIANTGISDALIGVGDTAVNDVLQQYVLGDTIWWGLNDAWDGVPGVSGGHGIAGLSDRRFAVASSGVTIRVNSGEFAPDGTPPAGALKLNGEAWR